MLYYTYDSLKTNRLARAGKEREMAEAITRLELLTLLLSIQALLESGNKDKAREIIAKVIAEAERDK